MIFQTLFACLSFMFPVAAHEMSVAIARPALETCSHVSGRSLSDSSGSDVWGVG
jgi:hypothetical protein